MSTVLRLFLLPHRDNRQMFFVLSLDPPIKQGQTRYHYLTLLFGNEEDTSIELPFTEEELKEKYEDKLTKELSGPVYEVLGKIMKVLINRKLTGPGSFVGYSGTPAIACSFKATAGYLYPLERGFIYVHKPPIHIRFEEISSVNFARSGGSTRSFDFEVILKSNAVHTFSSIEKEEYNKLFDFISAKKIHVKNTGKNVNYFKIQKIFFVNTALLLRFIFSSRTSQHTKKTLVIQIMKKNQNPMHIWHVLKPKLKNVNQMMKIRMNQLMKILNRAKKMMMMLLMNLIVMLKHHPMILMKMKVIQIQLQEKLKNMNAKKRKENAKKNVKNLA